MTRNRTLAGVALLIAASIAATDVVREDAPLTIGALDLARRLQRGDVLHIIDLRDSTAYATRQVPGAVLGLHSYSNTPDDIVVLYGPDAAVRDARRDLRGLGADSVFELAGGINAWVLEVLEPKLAIDATPAESTAYREAAPVSRFFGGMPRANVPRAEIEAAATTEAIEERVGRRGCE